MISTHIKGFFSQNYTTIEKVPSNKEVAPILKPDNISDKGFYNGTEWIETLTNEEIQEIEKLKEQEIESNKYIQRIQDGQNMYAQISSKFRLAKLNGELDQATHEFIEETFRPVREEVLAGQWITAFEIVQRIESQFVGSTIFEEIKTTIENYITENY